MFLQKHPGQNTISFDQIKAFLNSEETQLSSLTEVHRISLSGLLSKSQWQSLMLDIFQWDCEDNSRRFTIKSNCHSSIDYAHIMEGDNGEYVAWNLVKKGNKQYYQVFVCLTRGWLENLSLASTISLMDKLNSTYKFHLNHLDYCTLVTSNEEYEEWEFGEFLNPMLSY